MTKGRGATGINTWKLATIILGYDYGHEWKYYPPFIPTSSLRNFRLRVISNVSNNTDRSRNDLFVCLFARQ